MVSTHFEFEIKNILLFDVLRHCNMNHWRSIMIFVVFFFPIGSHGSRGRRGRNVTALCRKNYEFPDVTFPSDIGVNRGECRPCRRDDAYDDGRPDRGSPESGGRDRRGFSVCFGPVY